MTSFRWSLLALLVTSPALAAPAPEEADELAPKIRKSTESAVAALKKLQKEDGSWERYQSDRQGKGGASALAVLALLEIGVKADDETLAKGLKYLRTLKADGTYVVGLQTAGLCRANDKKDKELIEKNVERLAKGVSRRGERIIGWRYTLRTFGLGDSDNSCTQYALIGLHAASKAGVKADEKLWKGLREYYLWGQDKKGGWGYQVGGPVTPSMALAGLYGLMVCDEELGGPTDETTKARQRACARAFEDFRFNAPLHQGYIIYTLARVGRLHGEKTIPFGDKKQFEWYREGVTFLLKQQKDDGTFTFRGTYENDPALATSFALLFLAAGK